MKQTAVGWLKKELEEYGSSSHLSLDWTTFDELCEQAKEMEKEQIINAYLKSKRKRTDLLGALKIMDEAEQYYKETYEQTPPKL